jgi:GMP synthase (glutamine-hydrolysing)
MVKQSIVILDFGSQYTQLIARRIRALNVFSIILPHDTTAVEILTHNPCGIILSGGPSSVNDRGAPVLSKGVLDIDVPVLGVCYGMQLITKYEKGQIKPSKHREYGHTKITISKTAKSKLFVKIKQSPVVWMSHGDYLTKVPKGYTVVAKSANAVAAFESKQKNRYGVQFHPEVVHTEKGTEILSNFLFKICGAEQNWTMPSFIKETIKDVREKVGKGKVVLGLSGGVDSSVLAVLLAKALGKQLICVFINNGVLREGEAEKVQRLFRKRYSINLKYVDASSRFLKELKGITSPEEKRKIIGRVFIEVFNKAVKGFDFLAQGTLYPDVIESVSTKGPSDTIKTHHNRVNEVLEMKRKGMVIEPFEELFKDEVRELGKALKVSDEIVYRHPFPGPGLAIRILGDVDKEKLRILRACDAIVVEEIKAAGLYRKLWQAFAVLLPVKSVGVMGDQRTYGYTIAVRAVESVDAMTADFAYLPKELMTSISSKIIGRVKEVNRVVLDISSKPPSTIEWE